MNFTRIYAIFLRQLFLIRSNPARLCGIFIWIILDVILWGFITKYLNAISASGFNFINVLLGAVILWSFFVRIHQGTIMAYMEDVWSRNFLNLFSSPLQVREYISGIVLTSVITGAAGFAVMLVLAWLFFAYQIFPLGIYLLPFLGIIFLFGIALGIFTNSIMLRLGPAAEWFAWAVPAVISPLVGVFYPIAVLPTWLQYVSRVIPATYMFEGMRNVLANNAVSWESLLLGIILSLFYLVLAYLFFVRTYRYVLRTGLLARFNAESITA